MLEPRVLAKLDDVQTRFLELESALGSPEIASDRIRYQKMARQRADLETVVDLYRQYRKTLGELSDAEDMESSSTDKDMRDLAAEEARTLRDRLPVLEGQIKRALVPKDPLDSKNILVEVRPGAGGDEAGLFASDVLRMYTRYAETRRWKIETLELSVNDVGGLKQAIISINGDGAFGRLKYESGVHRVQRVPTTETQGRIHTSTITVAVLAEAEDVDIQIRAEDVKVDVYRSSGPGGQSVNTTDSAVRLTHLPTGVVVTCQDEKSQLKNKNKAMRVLRARLLESEREKQEKERSAHRKSQIGTGDRSERIRTYNFPQGRLTDHRINLTIYNLTEIMEGRLDEILDALSMADQEARLIEIA